ncbi:MAG: CPBP family intramembrane glutamic endopeptidase [Alphaproteobacteria bacterium]
MTNSLPITDWRLFFLLSALALASAIPLIPVVVVQGEAGLIAEPLGWRITAAAVLMGALLVYPAAVFVGLRIGGKLGLAAPLAEAWLAGRQPEDAAGRLSAGLALGAGFGLTGVIIALTQSGSTGEAEAASADIIPLWIGLAQAVSAGFGKEVLFRFGLMSLLAWFAWRVLPGRDGSPSAFGMWFAIAVAGLAFASVHSTPDSQTTTFAALQAVRLLAGAGFGWLFWKRGLEAAICAHFTYDMVLFYGIVMVL